MEVVVDRKLHGKLQLSKRGAVRRIEAQLRIRDVLIVRDARPSGRGRNPPLAQLVGEDSRRDGILEKVCTAQCSNRSDDDVRGYRRALSVDAECGAWVAFGPTEAKPVFDGPDRKEVRVVTREDVAVLKALGRYGSTRTELPNQGL